jgi:hypothetical protein
MKRQPLAANVEWVAFYGGDGIYFYISMEAVDD